MKWSRRFFVVTMLAGLLAGGVTLSPAEAGSWQDVDGNCSNGGVSGNTQYLWCWDKKKRVNDDTPTYDVFAFHMSLAGEATSGYLNRLWVEMDPRDTSPLQSWYSTDPRKPNQSYRSPTSCKTWSWTIGVATGVQAAYGESGTICSDKVAHEPVNNAEAGHHAGELWKSDCWASGVTKRVTAAVLVRVAPGKVPLWDASKHGMHQRRSTSTCESY